MLLTTRRPAACSATTPCENLFLWHALEESEHKAVAFDVYKAVGGTERLRVWTMKSPLGFIGGMASRSSSRCSATGPRTDPATPAQLAPVPRLAHRSRELWRQLKDYDRPDFHPDDRDTTELVEQWRARAVRRRGHPQRQAGRRRQRRVSGCPSVTSTSTS